MVCGLVKGLKRKGEETREERKIAEAYGTWKSALLQMPEVGESKSGVKYAEADNKVKAFSEIAVSTALYDALDHGDTRQDNLILMSKMPRYITEKFGISGKRTCA